jgi:L-amino acid N-acyltransferase YncA
MPAATNQPPNVRTETAVRASRQTSAICGQRGIGIELASGHDLCVAANNLSASLTGASMRFTHRDADVADLPRIVEIYNSAVLTRESTCDLEPITAGDRIPWFVKHAGSRRPIWVTEDTDAPDAGVIGYLAFGYFMNERPGYFGTSDLAIYLHPSYQGKRLGTYFLGEAIRHAPTLDIEVIAVTIFGSNTASLRLFERCGFERWGFMPRVARLGELERDLVMMGRRITRRHLAGSPAVSGIG